MKRSLHRSVTPEELGIRLAEAPRRNKIQDSGFLKGTQAAAISIRKDHLALTAFSTHLLCDKKGRVRTFLLKYGSENDLLSPGSDRMKDEFRFLLQDLNEAGCSAEGEPYLVLPGPSLLRRSAIMIAAGSCGLHFTRILSASQTALIALCHYQMIPMNNQDNTVLVLDCCGGILEATFANAANGVIEIIATAGVVYKKGTAQGTLDRLLKKLPLNTYPSNDRAIQCYYSSEETDGDLQRALRIHMTYRHRSDEKRISYSSHEIGRGGGIHYAYVHGAIRSNLVLNVATFRVEVLRNADCGGGSMKIVEEQFTVPLKRHIKASPKEVCDKYGKVNFRFVDQVFQEEESFLSVPVYEIWNGKDPGIPFMIQADLDQNGMLTLVITNMRTGSAIQVGGSRLMSQLTAQKTHSSAFPYTRERI